jgi:dTDP-L-rhamnose 4-epimerase
MSIYGEGLYRAADGRAVHDAERTIADLSNAQWELHDAAGVPLAPMATPETKTPALSSVYALTKFDQERLCLMIGQAYRMPTVAARFFNVYGPRQALSNPYTGVLAIFAARLLNRRPPVIYEDGEQRRDFVSAYDVARALRLSLEAPDAAGRAINIGSGQSASVREIAGRLAAVLDGEDIEPEITGSYRVGDIRHCFADISLARTVLGYEPQMTLDAGLMELAGWLSGQSASDRVDRANAELTARGLTV